MTKRLLLNSSGLKVSKSGYSADTATVGQLFFATSANEYNGLFMSGSINVTDFVLVGSTQVGTVSFGQTFTVLPKVHAVIENPVTAVYPGGYVADNLLYAPGYAYWYWWHRTFEDRVEFYVQSNATSFPIPVYYRVFY